MPKNESVLIQEFIESAKRESAIRTSFGDFMYDDESEIIHVRRGDICLLSQQPKETYAKTE